MWVTTCRFGAILNADCGIKPLKFANCGFGKYFWRVRISAVLFCFAECRIDVNSALCKTKKYCRNAENPFATFFTGDFNAHSQYWWPSLRLSQVVSEPTNFEPNKKPSCNDLAITDQPNLILDSGTRASLVPYCRHQIIYCKINFRIPSPPPLDRKIWYFNRANSAAIKRSMTNFPWLQHLNLNTDSN